MKTTEKQKITKISQLKNVSVYVKEWFDKANGNSYFSGQITLNDGLPSSETIKMPLQYGYDSSSEYEAMRLIEKRFPRAKWDRRSLWQLRERGIPHSYFKQEGCTRKQCESFVA